MFLYAIDFDEYIKVGLTENIQQRANELVSINGKNYSNIFYIEDKNSQLLETKLHYILEPNRKEGEYYYFDFKKAVQIIIESNININDIESKIVFMAEHNDIDITPFNLDDKAILFDSRFVSLLFVNDHSKLIKMIKNIAVSAKKQNETMFIFKRFSEYRNQQFKYYLIDFSTLFLVIMRLRNTEYFKDQLELVKFVLKHELYDKTVFESLSN